MDDRNDGQKQYTGTKGLSLAIVIGIAIGTVIGKLMDRMNIGLMIGLVIGICGWVLLNRRKQANEAATERPEEEQGPEGGRPAE